jgi:hypothetical protein
VELPRVGGRVGYAAVTTPTHRPLLTGRGDSRISEHAMRGMLRSVASKTAIALPTRSSWLYADPQHGWLAYVGVTVAQLELPARAWPRA